MGCLPSRLGLIHNSCPGTFLYHPRVSFQSVLFWMQDFISSFVVFVCFETKFLSLWSPGGPETQSLLSSLSWVLRLQVWPVILDSPCFSSVRWRFDESHIYFTIKIEVKPHMLKTALQLAYWMHCSVICRMLALLLRILVPIWLFFVLISHVRSVYCFI